MLCLQREGNAMHLWQWAIGILVMVVMAELAAFWWLDRTASEVR